MCAMNFGVLLPSSSCGDAKALFYFFSTHGSMVHVHYLRFSDILVRHTNIAI